MNDVGCTAGAQPAPAVDIIVVSWNTRDLLRVALSSIRQHAGQCVRVIVVDNGSSDGSPDMVRIEFPEVRLVVNAENRGFGQANNQGFAVTSEPFVLLLNSDAELTPGALPALLAELERHPEAGAVGARLVFPDGSFQASFNRFPRLWHEALALVGLARLMLGERYPSASASQSGRPRAVDWVGGAAMLLRRRALETATGSKGFDSEYHMYSEEMDLCRRIRDAGWSIRYCPNATVVHHAGSSTSQRALDQPRLLWESRLLYYRKHRPPWEAALLLWMIRAAYWCRTVVWRLRSRATRSPSRTTWQRRSTAARLMLESIRSPTRLSVKGDSCREPRRNEVLDD